MSYILEKSHSPLYYGALFFSLRYCSRPHSSPTEANTHSAADIFTSLGSVIGPIISAWLYERTSYFTHPIRVWRSVHAFFSGGSHLHGGTPQGPRPEGASLDYTVGKLRSSRS